MGNKDQAQKLVADGLDKVKEVAAFCKISVATLYKLMERGELPYTKIGRSRRIPHKAVVELAARNLINRTQERD